MLQLCSASQHVGRMAAEDYGALTAQGREAVLHTLALHGMPDIADNLQHEHVIDPPAWERAHGLLHGAAFGLSHGLDQLALFRPPLADPQVAIWQLGACPAVQLTAIRSCSSSSPSADCRLLACILWGHPHGRAMAYP